MITPNFTNRIIYPELFHKFHQLNLKINYILITNFNRSIVSLYNLHLKSKKGLYQLYIL